MLKLAAEPFETLPGVQFVCVHHEGETTGRTFDDGELDERVSAWMKLTMALAQSMATQLELGPPRIVMSIHDGTLFVVAGETARWVGLVSREPSAAGMAIIAVKKWMEAPREDEKGEEKLDDGQ